MKKPTKHIRLEPDIAQKAARRAKAFSRSVPKEVNHTLRVAYAAAMPHVPSLDPN